MKNLTFAQGIIKNSISSKLEKIKWLTILLALIIWTIQVWSFKSSITCYLLQSIIYLWFFEIFNYHHSFSEKKMSIAFYVAIVSSADLTFSNRTVQVNRFFLKTFVFENSKIVLFTYNRNVKTSSLYVF